MRARLLSLVLLGAVGCKHAVSEEAPAPAASTALPAASSLTVPLFDAGGDAEAPLDEPDASAVKPEPQPAFAGPKELSAIDTIARQAIERDHLAGAVIAVVRGGDVVFQKAYGLRRTEPLPQPMTTGTVFDLASLTKVIATAPSVVLLAEQKKMRLSDKVAGVLPAFGQRGKEDVTIEQLLLHTSGLPDDNSLTEYAKGPEEALKRIYAIKPLDAPGKRFRYSDLGFIVLGALVEKVSGEPLDVFAQKHLFAPLGMKDTTYQPPAALAVRAAPTEVVDGELLAGRVHDPRARALGGVAGHAGLFSTAGDLARFARLLLNQGELDGARVLSKLSVVQMTAARTLPGEAGRRGLGWDIETSFSGVRGALQGGYGHTGFTGTSIWIEPKSQSAVIVLTSRLYPDGKGDPRRLRREVASVVAHLKAPPPKGGVLTGIDVLAREKFKALEGRRIGLITHAAGVDRRGVSSIDLLRGAPKVSLVALFSPEHGLRSEQDKPVTDGRDPRTGLPVYSLFGERTRPTDEQLKDIDTLVYDLADAGVRFYTYATTLGYALEAAAKNKIKMVVLDRPNPIGGVRVEGPVLEAGRTSFIGYHPLPIRYGMTPGELALLYNRERGINADLSVIHMEGWNRADTFDRTGLLWVNPSPNLRSVTEALLYPGVALLEMTNVSVGRGTDRPFERVGAPWIDGPKLAAALADLPLPGVRFTPAMFTPASSTHAGKACSGVEIKIEDAARFEPVRIGLALARSLSTLYPSDFEAKNILLLLGDGRTFAELSRGAPLDSVIAGFQPGLVAFLKVRERYLLYQVIP